MDIEINSERSSTGSPRPHRKGTVDSLTVLRRHNLVCFGERIIRDAGPPIDRDTLAKIQGQCRAQLPEALLRLWSLSFGGRLDYRLRVEFAAGTQNVECTELFHSESDGYHDIWGWIDDTRVQNFEPGSAANFDVDAPLCYLPIAGHDWSSRVLIDVSGGPEHGSVHAFRAGTPGAPLAGASDDFARVADNLNDFFQQLYFEQDPLSTEAAQDGRTDELRHIELALRSGNHSEAIAARFLRRQLQLAHLDWRSAVDAGQLPSQGRLVELALEFAAEHDELELVARLAGLGCRLDLPLLGGGTLLDHALMHNALNVVEYCLSGSEFPIDRALESAPAELPPNLVERLLARGAQANANLIHRCTALGNLESAQVLALALALSNPAAAQELRCDMLRWASGLEQRVAEESPSFSQRSLWQREIDSFSTVAHYLAVGQAS